MPVPRLHDEAPTKQSQQCEAVGADLYPPEDDGENESEPAFGADPFDILAYREEQGLFTDH
jgi:hypothetical protein